jgi:hypothetical protein
VLVFDEGSAPSAPVWLSDLSARRRDLDTGRPADRRPDYRACSVCSSDEEWGNYPLFVFVIAVVPMTAALLIGVVIGILTRPLWRSRPDPLDIA